MAKLISVLTDSERLRLDGREDPRNLVTIHENRYRKNSIFERNSPIQTTNIARKIVNVIGPDHRTKGRRTHTDNIAAHNKKASQKSLPPIPQPISPRRSQGKNRALVGSGTIGGQVNQRTQSGIPGASAREGGIWPRNREGGRGRRRQRLARHDFSPNNDGGRKRERLLLGRATAGAARVLFCVRLSSLPG